MQEYDLAVVGSGIVGLAHAWTAARQGARVLVCERTPEPVGASIRNFGMIWPIGQPAGDLYQLALQSRSRWCELAASSDLWLKECGSLHLAHQADEWSILQEFAAQSTSHGIDCQLLTPEEIQKRTPGANPDGLLGGFWSPTEVGVNPRTALRTLISHLYDNLKVDFRFQTHVARVQSGELETSTGEVFSAERIVICSGSDFESLYPETFADAGLVKCKLQMLAASAPANWQLGPHLASGLTLRHYRSFEQCESLTSLKKRIAEEAPELDRFGIHVMMSQNDQGDIILGDSHEYGLGFSPFGKAEIDDLMLRELRKVFSLQDWTISQRWQGVYAKHPQKHVFVASPDENVHVVTATGGAGMTLSFGIADQNWSNWESTAKTPQQST